MTERVHQNPNLIFSEGTQVVSLRDVVGQNGRTLHPRGAVGVIVRSPGDLDHAYRVRFPDGFEEALRRDDIVMLAYFKEGEIGDVQISAARSNLYDRVIFRRVIGSRAYRVLLTGIHLMRTGEIEANLVRLNDEAKLPYLSDLIARKTVGPELGRLEAANLKFHEAEYERLRSVLQSAFVDSQCPEVSTAGTALNELLIRVRLSGHRKD